MKRVFETAECEAVRNSIFWELRYKTHENQMKGCGVELRVSDSQMNPWTWRVYDTVKARQGMADDRYAMLYRLEASLNMVRHSMGSQWSCLRRSVDVSEQEREDCCVTTLASACFAGWRGAMCFCGQPNNTELAQSNLDDTKAEATEMAIEWSIDERMRLHFLTVWLVFG